MRKIVIYGKKGREDIPNVIPYYSNQGTAFADMPEPSAERAECIRHA